MAMKPHYSRAFKSKMVQRVLGPRGGTARALGRELGIPQSTLSSWLRRAEPATLVRAQTATKEQPMTGAKRSTDDKARILYLAAGCTKEELGELLRREGVYEADLERWRAALEGGAPTRSKAPERKRIKELEREVRRKDKALAEMTALAVLKKKALEIWGDGDDGTGEKNE